MITVLHLSDPHFGTEQRPVMEALLRFAHAQSPVLAILSGDVTQRAQPSEFRAAKVFMDRLAVPASLVIPGNHDIPLFHLGARLFTPYGRFAAEFGHDLEPVIDTEALLVIGVKTTRRYRHIDGEISSAQIARVARRLQLASPAQLRIVVTHQPVHVINPQDRKNLLHGGEAAIRGWAAAGADLILGGHIHRPFVSALHTQFTGLPRSLWLAQAGTALSSRIRHDAGNSINLIRYPGYAARRHCTIERWDYAATSGTFEMVHSEELQQSSAPWATPEDRPRRA